MAKKKKEQLNTPPAQAFTPLPKSAVQQNYSPYGARPFQQGPGQTPMYGYGLSTPMMQRPPQGQPMYAPQRPNQPMPQGGKPQAQGKKNTPKLSKRSAKKLKKIKKREKDYFYVMRKLPCFFIFLFCLVVFAFSAGGLVASFIEMPQEVVGIMAITVIPDPTPMEDRKVAEGDTYDDLTVSFTAGDYLLLSINGLLGGIEKDEDGNYVFDEEGKISPALSFLDADKAFAYEEFLSKMEDIAYELEDGMSVMIFKFAPILLLLTTIASLGALITSFLALFGKRIFKGFFIAGLIMLISAVGMFAVGLIDVTTENFINLNPDFEYGAKESEIEKTAFIIPLSDDEEEEVEFTSLLDFGNLMPFLMDGAFALTPESEADIIDTPSIAYRRGAGIGFYGLFAGSLIVTVAGLWAKKRVPYSIFDK